MAFTDMNKEKTGGQEGRAISLDRTPNIPTGTVLAGKYVIEKALDAKGGEASLYTCTYRRRTYIAKVYRRHAAVKADVTLALAKVSSKYVAKLYATGTWNGMPFEILPYYQNGSLEGKRFSFHQLRHEIIPALNAGLYALHRANIIHKDLKPSNIMLCDDQRTVAIIDFGISSIREGGSSIVVTRTGMTPEYAAPETFRNLYLEESDYYSLGVTIYELYCGHTPYSGVDRATIEQFVFVQKIPFPDDFPQPLRELVTGLTYSDITNRREKDNPNRRWMHAEVARWCKGIKVPLPETQDKHIEEPSDRLPFVFLFMEQKFRSLSDLTMALALNWENGKERVYHSPLATYFRGFNTQLAQYCEEAERGFLRNPERADIEYFRLIYRLNPKLPGLYWKDGHYDSMQAFGNALLNGLRQNRADIVRQTDQFIANRLFSIRSRAVDPKDEKKALDLSAIEAKYKLAVQREDWIGQYEQMYLIGYMFSGTNTLRLSQFSCTTFEEFWDTLKATLERNVNDFQKLAEELVIERPVMPTFYSTSIRQPFRFAPQFSAWLYAVGKGSEAVSWKTYQALMRDRVD